MDCKGVSVPWHTERLRRPVREHTHGQAVPPASQDRTEMCIPSFWPTVSLEAHSQVFFPYLIKEVLLMVARFPQTA